MAQLYSKLVSDLMARSNAKQASLATKAAANEVSEKDPAEKGTTMIPKDPNATNAAQNLPANSTNTELTPQTQPPPVSTTIKGEEKPASLSQRAAGVVTLIKGLMGNKSAGEATAEKVTPVMPKSDNKNEDKVKEGLPATGKDNKSGTPDPNAAKTAGTAEAPEVKDPAAEKVKKPEGDSKGEIPKDKENADTTMVGNAGKSASEEEQYDPVILMKLAGLMLATEDGRAIALREVEKANGAAAAEDIVKAATFMAEQAAELDALEQAGVLAAQEAWDKSTPEQREQVLKVASVQQRGHFHYSTEWEKQAFDNGMAMAGQAMDAGMGEMPPGGEAGAEGEEAPSPEEILAIVQQLLASGQIDEATAAEIAAALSGGEGAGAPEGGGGEELPPEAKAAAEVFNKAAAAAESLFKEFSQKE